MATLAWVEPGFSRKEVDAAGATLVSKGVGAATYSSALAVVENWRSAHAFPLNTFQMGLRRRSKLVDPKGIVAQRLKRLSSIEFKLKRFSSMPLSKMQDLGGCRAVLHHMSQVRQLETLYRESGLKHELIRTKDYIAQPKTSGYRSLHLIYRYHSDKKQTYNGLQIEIQCRTQLQHVWATAVETVGTFLDQSLKSSKGSSEWLRFFALVSSAFAAKEKMAPVPGAPAVKGALVRDMRLLSKKLQVPATLSNYQKVVKTGILPNLKKSDYFLLTLRPSFGSVTVKPYRLSEIDVAAEAYLKTEREIEGESGSQAVLVAAESVASLLKAYPNYFLDTAQFLSELSQIT